VAGLAGGLEPVGLAEVQAQVAAIGGETGADAPDENGYVADPPDAAAYVSASDVVAKHSEELNIPTVRELGRLLERFSETKIRWTRPRTASGKPDKRRRLVHLGDWLTYAKACGGADAEQAGIEARKVAIRAAKHG